MRLEIALRNRSGEMPNLANAGYQLVPAGTSWVLPAGYQLGTTKKGEALESEAEAQKN